MLSSRIMRIAIVGSRRRTDRHTVIDYVNALPASAAIISGGARGPDTWARDAAKARGLPYVEHLPDLNSVRNKGEATRRYYSRNQKVVDDCDLLVALVAPDRRGGTEDTIRRASAAGKPVILL